MDNLIQVNTKTAVIASNISLKRGAAGNEMISEKFSLITIDSEL